MTARILIAEDEPFILESLTFLFTRAGYELTAVQNGAAVIERVSQWRPDLVILDTMLPGRDGFDILGDLRASNATRQMPVIVLTAKGQQADRKRMMALGANVFITKPFANQELLGETARLLAAHKATPTDRGVEG